MALSILGLFLLGGGGVGFFFGNHSAVALFTGVALGAVLEVMVSLVCVTGYFYSKKRAGLTR